MHHGYMDEDVQHKAPHLADISPRQFRAACRSLMYSNSSTFIIFQANNRLAALELVNKWNNSLYWKYTLCNQQGASHEQARHS